MLEAKPRDCSPICSNAHRRLSDLIELSANRATRIIATNCACVLISGFQNVSSAGSREVRCGKLSQNVLPGLRRRF